METSEQKIWTITKKVMLKFVVQCTQFFFVSIFLYPINLIWNDSLFMAPPIFPSKWKKKWMKLTLSVSKSKKSRIFMNFSIKLERNVYWIYWALFKMNGIQSWITDWSASNNDRLLNWNERQAGMQNKIEQKYKKSLKQMRFDRQRERGATVEMIWRLWFIMGLLVYLKVPC